MVLINKASDLIGDAIDKTHPGNKPKLPRPAADP